MDIKTSSRVDNHRVVVTFTGHPDFSMDVRYEPEKHAIRVLHGGSRRLFFYEADNFFPSRGTLINEYGLVLAKLQLRNPYKGLIQFEDTRVTFAQEPGENWVTLHIPGVQDPVYWHHDFAHNGDERQKDSFLFRALLMVLAWSVGVPTLQA